MAHSDSKLYACELKIATVVCRAVPSIRSVQKRKCLQPTASMIACSYAAVE